MITATPCIAIAAPDFDGRVSHRRQTSAMPVVDLSGDGPVETSMLAPPDPQAQAQARPGRGFEGLLLGSGARQRGPLAARSKPTRVVLHAVSDFRKPLDLRSWRGANHSDARWHREGLQRRRGCKDAVLCRE
jgi:hypothetical protein